MIRVTDQPVIYSTGPRELEDWNNDLPDNIECLNLLHSAEVSRVWGSEFISTGESLEEYKQRRKEGRVWRAS